MEWVSGTLQCVFTIGLYSLQSCLISGYFFFVRVFIYFLLIMAIVSDMGWSFRIGISITSQSFNFMKRELKRNEIICCLGTNQDSINAYPESKYREQTTGPPRSIHFDDVGRFNHQLPVVVIECLLEQGVQNLLVLLCYLKVPLRTLAMQENERRYGEDDCQVDRVVPKVVVDEGLQKLVDKFHGQDNSQLISQIQKMGERPDHPHQAAVHLMKALRCCKQCYEVSQADLLQIRQLQYRKDLLAEQLRSLSYKADSTSTLRREIQQLQMLIFELRSQNAQAQQIGAEQINQMSIGRQQFQTEQREGILVQLKNERNLTQELSLQLESLLERVKYLNRINNELIYNFCG